MKRGNTPEPRWQDRQTSTVVIRSHYFIYFAVLGVYLPYFNLYCYHLDFSGMQIGLLSGARSLTLVLFSLLWGALADRYQMRRGIFIACSGASVVLWGGYLLTVDFAWMLLITIVYGIFFSPLISFLEAFTMDVLGRRRQRYGNVRVWGSVSFIVTVLVLGRLMDRYPLEGIVVLILAGSGIQFLLAFGLPPIRRPAAGDARPRTGLLLRAPVVGFLTGAFLMLVSHGTYYGFFSIHLEQLHFGRTFIGLAWALASTAEIAVMLGSGHLLRRLPLEKVLVWSFPVAALRWVLVPAVTSAPAILATQLLHAVTYGAFHVASILYMDRLVPASAKTLGQAANNAVTYGLGLMVGFLLNGWGFERLGTRGLFGVSAAIALAGGLLMAWVVRRTPGEVDRRAERDRL